MGANFKIRTASLQDRPVLRGLMESLQDAERELHLNRRSGSEISDAHLAYLEGLVKDRNGKIYVAESEEGILGFVVCFIEKLDEGDLHVVQSEREYGYISDLYVVSAMRKRGVATALMEAAERHFLNLNLAVVRVGLLCSNEAAIRFYGKAGYQPYEVLYEKHLHE